MTTLDIWYAAFVVAVLAFDSLVLWPSFVRRGQRDAAPARVWLWATTIGVLWTLAIGGVVAWRLQQRPWSSLGLVYPGGWRLLGTIGLLLAGAIVHFPTAAKVARAKSAGQRIRLPDDVSRRVPHNGRELAWWLALSMSAGVCEEFVFRGYLISAFRPILGVWGAATVSLVVFAAAHSYQGAKGVLAVAGVGALLTLIMFAFGSIIPAMAVHVLVDAIEGSICWYVLREGRLDRDGSTVAARA